MLAVVLGQGADRLGDDRVEGGQLLIDYLLRVGGEVNQDLAATSWASPAGHTVNVSLCDYFRVDNGALVEHWGVMDAAGIRHQLTGH